MATMSPAQTLYLDLLKRVLTRYGFDERFREVQFHKGSLARVVAWPLQRLLRLKSYVLCRPNVADLAARERGADWPANAETMIGLKRLQNIETCALDVLRNRVPGDFIETGIWRGGASIFMRAVLEVADDTGQRKVWACDSFQGVPKPNPEKYAADAAEVRSEAFWKFDQLAVSLEAVKANFARYGLLDDRVVFLKGWFSETLPTIPESQRFALIRLDGDLYESTWDAITNLYPKLSIGGYCLVDDYGGIPVCAQAIEDYRRGHGITESIIKVDNTGVYWQKLH